jgi:hypothetical protein
MTLAAWTIQRAERSRRAGSNLTAAAWMDTHTESDKCLQRRE